MDGRVQLRTGEASRGEIALVVAAPLLALTGLAAVVLAAIRLFR